MVLKVRLATGEVLDVGENIMRSLERCLRFSSLDEVQKELRYLLGTQCTIFPGEDSVCVWPWVIGLCHVYKEKGHILKDFEEVPSDIHAKFLKLEFLEGHTLETFRKSVREEASNITMRLNEGD